MQRMQSGRLRWHLFEDAILPRIQSITNITSHPAYCKIDSKARVLAYVVLLLIVLKRSAVVSKIFVRASQLIALRYVVKHLAAHFKFSDMAGTLLARL
jgi:hypothetical protein